MTFGLWVKSCGGYGRWGRVCDTFRIGGRGGLMSEDQIVRRLLAEIERNPAVSQRKLSDGLGMSVGSVNWYLKRCIKKGLIKLSQAPVRRYLYYLTPEGFAEKTRLTARYLSVSFDIFRVGREQYETLLQLCAANGWRNIVLLGDSELAELVRLVAARVDAVALRAVLDPGSGNRQSAGIPVIRRIEELDELLPENSRPDALIGTDFEIRLPGKYDLPALQAHLGLDEGQILIPAFI